MLKLLSGRSNVEAEDDIDVDDPEYKELERAKKRSEMVLKEKVKEKQPPKRSEKGKGKQVEEEPPKRSNKGKGKQVEEQPTQGGKGKQFGEAPRRGKQNKAAKTSERTDLPNGSVGTESKKVGVRRTKKVFKSAAIVDDSEDDAMNVDSAPRMSFSSFLNAFSFILSPHLLLQHKPFRTNPVNNVRC